MKKKVFNSCIFFLLIFTFQYVEASNFVNENNNNWKAGVARVIITPQQPMWMAGYASRTKPSDGKLHDLWAKALALEDMHGEQGVLVTTDLLGLPKKMSDNIRHRLKEKFDLSKAQIILNSSHTHSGPVLQDALFDIYPLDSLQLEKIRHYSDKLEIQIVDLVEEALNSMTPVQLYSNNGVTRFQVNRRNNNESTLNHHIELKGPNDYAVPVIKVMNNKGDLIAVTFGYACHPTVLNINQWSGDYPGFAQLEIEKSHPGVTAMFFQGAGANQNPLPRRTIALAEQYGKELAAAVDRVLAEPMQPLLPKLETAYSEIELSFEIPSYTELKQMEKEFSSYQKRWASRMIDKLDRGQSLSTSYPFPVQIWKLGNQMMFSMGGETLIEYSIGLKRIFGYEIFVLGYSNDVMAYIPSAKVIEEGGYEGESSQRVYGMSGKWDKNIETQIYNEFFLLAKQVGVEISDKYKHEMLIRDYQLTYMSQDANSLTAKHYFSGFNDAHDTYNAISEASNGKIYYVLSSASIDKGGQMYVYDPETDKTKFLADLTEICGEKDSMAISQGKSHVRFHEKDSVLYFSTHIGYYEMIDGMERLPVTATNGYKLYPGGHFMSYNLTTGEFKELALSPDGEGIITMTLDKERGHIYGITWPKGYFVHYDLNNGTLKNLGLISANGEAGTPGEDYRVLCRSMFVDHRDGLVYYSTSEGDIFSYKAGGKQIKKVEGVNLRLDYLGKYDPTNPGNMGYNWRQIIWNSEDGAAYGVHGNSGYLFRFDPKDSKIEILDRITSEPSKKSGMFDYFSYGYLGFQLGPDEQTLYYLTGGPIYVDGQRSVGKDSIAMGGARGLENLHLITYNIQNRKYIDHGPIFYEDGKRPTYVNSIAVGPNGNVYTLARFEQNGKIIEDLVKIPNPFLTKK